MRGIVSFEHPYDPFVLDAHVFVAPSPDFRVTVAPVAGPQRSSHHHARVGGLQVVRQPESGASVYERRAQVHPVVAQLGRLVVPRERVMVVVPSLAQSQQRHRRVFRGRDSPVRRQSARVNDIRNYYSSLPWPWARARIF